MGGAGGAGGPFGAGKSTAKFFNKEVGIGTKFKDVAGCEEAKVCVFLKNGGRIEGKC